MELVATRALRFNKARTIYCEYYTKAMYYDTENNIQVLTPNIACHRNVQNAFKPIT